MTPDLQKDLAWAVDSVRSRLDGLRLTRDYYEGNHRLVFATEKYRNTFGDLFREFADNFCDDVVDESVDRLAIQAWTSQDEAKAQAAMEQWDALKGHARLGSTARESWGQGDGYIILWPGPDGQARWHVQRSENMAVRYSTEDPDVVEVAAKVWREGRRYRATLYYGDGTVARFATKGVGAEGGIPQAKSFLPYAEVLADGTVQESVEVSELGHMPVYHLPADEVGAYGRSVLADVIPLQDGLNKSVSDLLVAMEKVALPGRWAVGVEVAKDENGRDIDPFDEKKPVWWTSSKEASLGQFPQASMGEFLKVQDSLRLEIARKGCLPVYSVPTMEGTQSGVPSGISLKVQEGRQNKRVTDWARDNAPTLQRLMADTLTLNGMATEPEDLEVEWASPATEDEKTLLEGLQIKVMDLGVTKTQAQKELGYDPETIAEMADQADRDPLEAPLAPGGRTTPMPTEAAAKVDGKDQAAELKARFDALGAAIRSGVDPQEAADRVGLNGLAFTGAVPVSLRMPRDEADTLEQG